MASSSQTRQEEESDLGGPVFNPPLYKQRYHEVVKIAREMKAKKVVDMGCAECKLLKILKQEPYIEQLFGVDYDPLPLRLNERIVQPFTIDYLMPRDNPLQFTLMQGSIAEPDSRLMHADLMSCVEVIEHLDAEVLERVPESVFGVLQPGTVVVTTPNAEFNVLFPGFSGFRHHDHRFEWTRAEFEAWCSGIIRRYPVYTVKYSGIGAPMDGKEEVGFCSQMAVFTRDSSNSNSVDHNVGTPYTIISSAEHPHSGSIDPKQKLCSEAEYYLTSYSNQQESSYLMMSSMIKLVLVAVENFSRSLKT